MTARAPQVEVVVVSYNSRNRLRACVSPFAGVEGIRVTVVDNASTDATLEALHGLPVHAIPLPRNRGFGYGCNIGWRSSKARHVLFLNPDARISPSSVRRLAATIDEHPSVGAAAPRILT